MERKYKIIILNALIFGIYFFIYSGCLATAPFWDDIILFGPNAPDSIDWNQFLGMSWPVFYLFMQVLKQLFGNDPLYFHLTSVSLHLGNAILLYLVLRELLGKKLSWTVSVLFLLHPMNYYAVTWIIQIKTLLSYMFFLISLLFIKRLFREDSYLSGVGAILFFLLSAFTKSMLIGFTLPLAFILFIWGDRIGKRRKTLVLTGFLLISFLSFQSTVNGWKFKNYYQTEEEIRIEQNRRKTADMILEKYFVPMNKRYEESLPGKALRFTVSQGIYFSKVLLPRIPRFFPVPELPIGSGTMAAKSIFFIFFLLSAFLAFYLIFKGPLIAGLSLGVYLLLLSPFCHLFYIPLFRYTDHAEYWIYCFIPFALLAVVVTLARYTSQIGFNLLLGGLVIYYSTALYGGRNLENDIPAIIINGHDVNSGQAYLIYDLYGAQLFNQGRYYECFMLFEHQLRKFPQNERMIELRDRCLFEAR